MSTVVVCTDGTVDESASCTPMLRDAGFDVRFEMDAQFAHGECDPRRVLDALEGADAVLAWGEPYTAALFDARPDLRIVARVGVGFESVDIPAATARNIVVTITPNANHECVAEHALALMFAVAKRIVVNDVQLRQGGWPSDAVLRPLREQTLGIVGLGRTGRSLAVRAQAMRMRVIATDVVIDPAYAAEQGIELTELDDLLERSDFVSLNCPLNDQTAGLMGAAQFQRMKPGAIFINVARGGLMDQAALVDALGSGHLGGAGLDVFEHEPTDAGCPLYRFDNVVGCPHIAGNDTLALDEMVIEAAQCVIDLKAGRWPEGAVVNPELKESWKWSND